ncbi:alpha/beta hydrolase [Mycolicibacterium sp. XJ1819]
MALHPEAVQMLNALHQAGVKSYEEMTVPAARSSGREGIMALQGERVEMASVINRTIPGPAGEIPIRIYIPGGGEVLPVLMYYHGGGWVLADLDVPDRVLRVVAKAANAIVVSVDYRLAPEHRYPAAFDDCYAATAWVAEHAAEFGGDPGRLAVSGDSAGGNLAAAVALAARDRGGPALSAQLLIYPILDFNFETQSYRDKGEGYILTKANMIWFWAHYLGAQPLDNDPYACPLRANDVAGLPNTYIATAEYDPLCDEGEHFGVRLEEAGVPTTTKRFEGMLHGFFWTLAANPSASGIIDDLVATLHKAWA